jgi:hypothetical protein
MTRNVARLYLDSASLKALRELLGQHWGGVTGDLAPEAPGLTLASWAEVTAEIGGRAWTFSSRMTGSNFEGFDEEYPSLHVSAGGSRMEAASAAGRVFHQHRGESVEAIFIVRETITRSVDGEEKWQFGTDYAVVLELSSGAIGIFKGGHHDEALFVNIADDVDSIVIPDRSTEWNWDNQIGEHYEVNRVWIPLGEIAPVTP